MPIYSILGTNVIERLPRVRLDWSTLDGEISSSDARCGG